MIDWHSHILPGIDDGSHDVEESLSLLNIEKSQGVDTVIATPHFYPNDESIEEFLEKREGAFEALKAKLTSDLPNVVMGAEVYYYPGISRLENLESLVIQGTKLLLLEMPMTSWNEYMIKELIVLSGKNGITVVLAHIDRYLDMQKKHDWQRLAENGILFQVNASFFSSVFKRGRAIALLKKGCVQFIGSDCHGVSFRPPTIGKAFETIKKKLGDEFLSCMNEYGLSILS